MSVATAEVNGTARINDESAEQLRDFVALQALMGHSRPDSTQS